MADIRLEHVCKVYPNGVKAVSDFTMDITDKEFIVFVGPSGCGKSTTLRMIAGLEEISAGNIYIDGVNVNRVEPKDRDVAMVFQNYALYPHMTVYDNMAFALKIRKLPKNVIDEKVRAAAEVLGITDYLNTKPKDMSGGQRQRVALGRAMVREPKVFLLDEPLSNLDAKLRTAMRSEIAKLHRKLQTTFIYVTHDQVEAMTMGTRIVVMKDGFIQQIDTPGNLYNFPCNKFVAGFIGTPQMNFYKATLFLDGETVRVKFVDSDTEFAVPFENFAKADKTCLNGEKLVYVGIRSEHVSIDPDKFPCKAKCRVSYAENLGVESQVYADFNLDSENTLAESPTKVIIKAAAGATFEDDSVIDVSVDFNSVHVFDAETEQSVLPRVPQYSTVKMTVKDNVATILSGKVTLPPALALPDGEYDLQLPTEAVTLGGGWKVPVWRKEDVDGKTLMFLGSTEETAFALCDSTSGAGFSIDFSKCVISAGGAPIISAVPTENRLNFTVVKEGKTRTISIGGVPLSCSRVTDAVVDSFGREAYKHVFQLVFTPADVAIGGEIAAKAEAVLDYGSKKYLKCSIGDEAVYVETDDVAEYAVDSQVTLTIDEKKVHVYSPDVDLIIL